MKYSDFLKAPLNEQINHSDADELTKQLYDIKGSISKVIFDRIKKFIMTGETKTAKEELAKLSLKEATTPEELLRKDGFKIKSIHGTKFGTEYLMAKLYDQAEIKKTLKAFSVKFDGKSIFVVD